MCKIPIISNNVLPLKLNKTKKCEEGSCFVWIKWEIRGGEKKEEGRSKEMERKNKKGKKEIGGREG